MPVLICTTPRGKKVRLPYHRNETISDLKKRIAAHDGSDWRQISIKAWFSRDKDIAFNQHLHRASDDMPLGRAIVLETTNDGQNKTHARTEKRCYRRVCKQIVTIGREIGLGYHTIGIAMDAYQKASACRPYRDANDRAVAAAYIYAACQVKKEPRDLELISFAAKVPEKTIAYHYREHKELLRKAYDSWHEQKTAKVEAAANNYATTGIHGRARTAGDIAREAGLSEAAIEKAYKKANEICADAARRAEMTAAMDMQLFRPAY